MASDKKKKKKKEGKDGKKGKGAASAALAVTPIKAPKPPKPPKAPQPPKPPKALKALKVTKAAKRVKALTDNPLVADLVAAALVATAAALKDPNKARRMAEDAGDELGKLQKAGSERGSELWQLALEVGRRAIDGLGKEAAPKRRRAKAK